MKKSGFIYRMEQSMRWFGPEDPVSLSDIKQAGCTSVVTALHHISNGETWSLEEINKRKQVITAAGLKWEVVESLPVHESIKIQKSGFQNYIDNYLQSLTNLRACGIKVVTYNFMPVLDWTRTDLQYLLPDGSKALRFEWSAYMAFDLFILNREHAKNDYTTEEYTIARERFEQMSDQERQILCDNIIAGLPGSEEHFSLAQFRSTLSEYKMVNRNQLKEHLVHFLHQVTLHAESLGVYMAIHPDDPPYPLFGLPRVVSDAQDLQELFSKVPSPANGLCFCTGSLGVRPDNNLVEMIHIHGERIKFAHLRSVKRNHQGDFFEDNHLEGDVDMYRIVRSLIDVMQQYHRPITIRPDHGHQMLDDLCKTTNPGYSAIGRLRGLAEIRGLEEGIIRNIIG